MTTPVDLSSLRKDGKPPALTAFLVIVNPDGSAVATNDLNAPPTMRSAAIADMRRACMEISADIAASQAADMMMQKMATVASQQASQMQAQQILADLERRKS